MANQKEKLIAWEFRFRWCRKQI